MSYRLLIRDSARIEYRLAAGWYAEKSKRAASIFVARIEAMLESIRTDPFRFAIVDRDVREAIVPKYPFAIYFRISDENEIRILAIFHTSRDPAELDSRIETD